MPMMIVCQECGESDSPGLCGKDKAKCLSELEVDIEKAMANLRILQRKYRSFTGVNYVAPIRLL